MGSLLGGREKFMFDGRNVEVMRLAGAVPVILWSFQKYIAGVTGALDCLYGEPVVGSKHYIPYKIYAFFEKPTQLADTLVGGLVQTNDARVYLSRKDLENKKVPKEYPDGDMCKVGDIIQFFRNGKVMYFEARNVERDGWVNDSEHYTQYLLDCVNTTSFTPDQKLLGSL